MNVLVTGATGFIGSHLVPQLLINHTVAVMDARLVRQNSTEWHRAVDASDVLVHLAGRAHVATNNSASQRELYREMNTGLTLRLAERSALGDAKRFIFLSTARVLGNVSNANTPFQVTDVLHPADSYAESKAEAETGLQRLSSRSTLNYIIIRPPLVYGPRVKANFLSMLNWVDRERLLPLGNTQNLRSFVGVRNLVNLIEQCITHPNARNQIFHVADSHDLSTTDLLKTLADALGRKARLISVPRPMLRIASQLLGRPRVFEQLCESFRVDISSTRQLLDWSPPFTTNEELIETARWFREVFPR